MSRYRRPTIEVIDLVSHKVGCQRCRSFGLCPAGRGLVYLASSALYDASVRQLGSSRVLGEA